AAGVRDAERFQRALHGPVFAETSVQRDEHAIEAVLLQLEQIAYGRIEWIRVDAFLAQRAEHGIAGQERNFALRRRTAHQHGDFSEVVHGSPMIRTSGSRSTPVCARTVPRTCAMSASISAALARPSGLMMKFACISETRAPP